MSKALRRPEQHSNLIGVMMGLKSGSSAPEVVGFPWVRIISGVPHISGP